MIANVPTFLNEKDSGGALLSTEGLEMTVEAGQ